MIYDYFRVHHIIKHFIVLVLVCSFYLTTGCESLNPVEIEGGCSDSYAASVDSKTEEYEEVSSDSTDCDTVYVYVCGDVKDSGLYELKAGSRIGDAIDAAGGFTKSSDKDALNLAEIVTDGSKIMVPKKGALVDEGMSVAEDSSASDLININTADVKELTTLAGIGEARAEAIIEYREQHGGFSKIEDIMNVSGIKEAMFSRIKDDISV